MAAKTNKLRDLASLQRYSVESQEMILKLFIENPEFQEKASKMNINEFGFNTNSYGSEYRRIAGWVKDFIERGIVVNYTVLRLKNESETSNAVTKDVIDEILTNLSEKRIEPSTADFLTDSVYKMITADNALTFMNKINLEIANVNVNTDVEELIDGLYKEFKANSISQDTLYEKLDSSSESIMSIIETGEDSRVPTSSKILNKYLGGGLPKTNLGLFFAGSGVGKTCVTCGFVCYAAGMGYKVAHFALEDLDTDIKKKYISYFTNIAVNKQQENKERIINTITAHGEKFDTMLSNIRTVYAIKKGFKKRKFSVNDIDRGITELKNQGFFPDLVVVDYYDRIVSNSKSRDIWVRDEETINDLSDLAVNQNIALWVACQGGKEAQNPNSQLNLSSIRGGVWKTFTAQIIVSFQKFVDGDGMNWVTVKTLKNRYAPKTEFQVQFDNGTCRFGEEERTVEAMEETDNTVDNFYIKTAKEVINNKK